MNETELVKDMGRDFRAQHLGAFWRKIHGDKFQAGFPDVICALPDVAALTEFKWCDTDRILMQPFGAAMAGLLTGLQFAELAMLGAIGAPCPLRARILVGCPVETDAGSYEMAFGCDVADLPRYKTFSALDVINVALGAKAGGAWHWDPQFFPTGAPEGLEFQLRRSPSDEPWRVGALVLGMRRYKAFEVRTKLDPEMSYE